MTQDKQNKMTHEEAAAFFRARVVFCGMPSDNEAEARKNTETANTLRSAFEKCFLGDENQEGGAK